MIKAGIITYWQTKDNYGSILQNYAVQQVLSRYDIDAETLYSSSDKTKKINSILKNNFFTLVKKTFRYVTRKIYNKYCNRVNDKRRFSLFINENINVSPIIRSSELSEYCSAFDLCIVGSDQAWNFSDGPLTDSQIEDYKDMFLDFAPQNAKKVACAVSFGRDSFSPCIKPLAQELLRKFDFISVREYSGINICKDLGFENVFFQADPTLLLDGDYYRNRLHLKNDYKGDKYILLYLLNNDTDFNISKLKKWANSKGLNLIYVNGNLENMKVNFYKKCYPTIQEWLTLIDNAEYVFTNSFHGTVFSIIFNKMFITIPQAGKCQVENTRFFSLFKLLSLKQRLFAGEFESVTDDIDYVSVNHELVKIRKSSPFVLWLEKNFGLQEEKR